MLSITRTAKEEISLTSESCSFCSSREGRYRIVLDAVPPQILWPTPPTRCLQLITSVSSIAVT